MRGWTVLLDRLSRARIEFRHDRFKPVATASGTVKCHTANPRKPIVWDPEFVRPRSRLARCMSARLVVKCSDDDLLESLKICPRGFWRLPISRWVSVGSSFRKITACAREDRLWKAASNKISSGLGVLCFLHGQIAAGEKGMEA